MNRECGGPVKPAPIPLTIELGAFHWLREIASKRDRRRGYEWRRDTWGRGLIGNATFIGLVAEFAVCQFLNRRLQLTGKEALRVDEVDRPLGDQGRDVVLWGTIMQVKNRASPYGVTHIRRVDDQGNLLPLNWDVCITCTWDNRPGASLARCPLFKGIVSRCGNDTELGWLNTVVLLDGWFHMTDIYSSANFGHAWRGDHMNSSVPDRCLFDMQSLCDFLESRRPERVVQQCQ